VRSSSKETVTHFKCPDHVARALEVAGGTNPYGEPMFRVVWGWDRIVPFTGEHQEFEQYLATLTDKFTGISRQRTVTRLKRSVVETRYLPKYLPASCWHLEMWRPAEEYGTPEEWRMQGIEKVNGLTVDTAGEYPHRGEYELSYPLTDNGTNDGQPIPLIEDVVQSLVNQIRLGRGAMSFQLRKAAIEQREARREEGFVQRTMAMLKDGMPAHAGEASVTVLEPSKEAPKDEPKRQHAAGKRKTPKTGT
jgi:hypothetical protein